VLKQFFRARAWLMALFYIVIFTIPIAAVYLYTTGSDLETSIRIAFPFGWAVAFAYSIVRGL